MSKIDFIYTMICMSCEKTYQSISGIDDICHTCKTNQQKERYVMTDRKIADGCYHTSEFANLPERCDLPNGCHKGHLWIVDGKEQHHAPGADKYGRDNWVTIDPAKGNTMNRLDWQNIAITSKPPRNENND